MLKIIKRPVITKKTDDGFYKVVILYGEDDYIDYVVGSQRFKSEKNTQNIFEHWPQKYFVKVHYFITTDYSVNVLDIYVSFNLQEPAKHWGCFYDKAAGKKGRRVQANNRVFYYLEENDLEDILEIINGYEEKVIVSRLAKKGPSVFNFCEKVPDVIEAQPDFLKELYETTKEYLEDIEE